MIVFRTAVVIIWSAVAILLGFGPAAAEKRVALVIGNGAYQKVGKLANPANDAIAVADMLKAAGFEEVELYRNLGFRELRKAIGDFSDLAREADTAVVYYSGHGIEVDGVNYLIPIDAVLDRDIDVQYEAYSLDTLLKSLEQAKRLRLVMLDACRDNPFVRTMKRSAAPRAIGRGLAAVEPTSVNTLIGFAAKAGSYALDGEGGNSPYAMAVLNHLATPGLDLRLAFGRVRDEVMKTTKNKQEPFVYGSLGGANVAIVAAPAGSDAGAAPPSVAAVPIDRAAQAWMVTKDTTSVGVLEDFIRQFGNTPYGSMARARVEELKQKNVAAAVAPAASPNMNSAPPGPPNDASERAWAATQNTTNITVLESFIARFPGTFYADLARARIDELKKGQVAVAVSPTTQPKGQEKGISDSRSNQQGPRDAKSCGAIAGTWQWVNNRDVIIRTNGSMQAADGSIGGHWKCEEGVYILSWNHGYADRLTLSSDGRRLSGANNMGFAITATRRAVASASRETPSSQQTESQQQNQNSGGIGGLIGGVLKGAGDLVGGVLGGNNQQPQDARP